MENKLKSRIKTPISYYGGKQAIVNHLLAMVKAPRKSGPNKVEVLVSNYKSPCGTLDLFSPRHCERSEGQSLTKGKSKCG